MVQYSHRNGQLTVTTTSIPVLDNLVQGQTRVVYVISNISTGGQIITLAFGDTAAVAGYGLTLNPGNSWTETIESTFVPTNEKTNIISSAAGATVAIYERIRND